MQDSLRPESDSIIVGIRMRSPELTGSNYVLTKHPVPFSRFIGVWSLVDHCWIDRPKGEDLAKMTDYESE